MEDSSKYKHGIGDLILLTYREDKVLVLGMIIKISAKAKKKYYHIDWTANGTNNNLANEMLPLIKEDDVTYYKNKLNEYLENNGNLKGDIVPPK